VFSLVFSKFPYVVLDKVPHLARANRGLGIKLTSFHLVIIHKKFLDLFDQTGPYIKALCRLLSLGMGSDGNQSVVANPAGRLFSLFSFNRANWPRGDDAAGHDRRIHQNKDIEGVAIIPPCSRDKAEVVRKNHAFGQDFCELKAVTVGS
jgi:hypothetical protein